MDEEGVLFNTIYTKRKLHLKGYTRYSNLRHYKPRTQQQGGRADKMDGKNLPLFCQKGA